MIVDMPLAWTQRRGDRARLAILAELRRRERAGEDAPSMRQLADAIVRSYRQTRRYLGHLREAGLVDWEDRIGRSGASIRLTDAGRLVAGRETHA